MRDKGVISLIDGISKNPESRIHSIGLRFNFLTKKSVDYLFRSISERNLKFE